MNEFQERLNELLEDHKMSRLQLSKELGITSTTVNGYFNYGYYPQIDIATKMSKFFNCSLDFLYGLSDNIENLNIDTGKFFDKFNNLIKESKISIAKTLKDLKMSETNYYRWRNGLLPKTINLLEIAKYFNASIDYLIGNIK